MNILSRWVILSLLFNLLAHAHASNNTLASYLNEQYKNTNGIIILINPQDGKDIAIIDPHSLISHRFPPGSLIKPFLVIRALEDKRWRQDTVVYCSKGSCWYLLGHRQLNLTQAISYSCNRYFQEVAKGVDYERFLETIEKFGLITEKKPYLHLAAADTLNIMVGLGNNLLVNPVSLLYAYASIFNEGYLFSSEAKVKRRVGIRGDIVKILRNGMRDSAIYGTSHLAQQRVGIEEIFAKTGTAPFAQQRVGIEEIFAKTGTAPYCLNQNYDFTKTHAWFIGFYPLHKPIIAVLVFLMEGVGSKNAAKIGGEVISAFINKDKLPQQVAVSKNAAKMGGKVISALINKDKLPQQVAVSYISGWLFSKAELDTANLKFINELNPFSEWQILPTGRIKFRWGILPESLRINKTLFYIPTFRAVASQFNRVNTPALMDTLVREIIHKSSAMADGIELNIEADWKKKEVVNEKTLLRFLQRLKTASPKSNISLCIERDMIFRWESDTWKQIDKLVDQYKLLLYDYNKKSKVACAGAPVPQIREDLRRFLQLVPYPEKVILGVPTHGFFFREQKDGKYQYQGPVWYSKGLSFPKTSSRPVISYIESMKGQSTERQIIPATTEIINWDKYSLTPYIAFYKENKRCEIWYENADSLRHKIQELVIPFKLKGIALWRFGMEDTRIWS